MTTIHSRPRPAVVIVAGALLLLVAACGGSTTTPVPSDACCSEPPAPASDAPTPDTPTAATPTEVPGGASITPEPLPGDTTTTETDWGTILDAVPVTFPVYPGAEPADWPDGPVSGAWLAGADADEVGAWYLDTLRDLLAVVELGAPLEDGSRTLDAVADIPECRLQLTFRPVDGSTMITVLYGAGCAGGNG